MWTTFVDEVWLWKHLSTIDMSLKTKGQDVGKIVVVGSINMDVVAQVARMPRPGETILGSAVTLLPGGKGANQAVAAQRIGGADGEVVMVGALGTDDFAATLRSFLASEGVDVSAVAHVAGPSGTALIAVDGRGENSIVIVPGANSRVDPGAATTIDLAPADVVVMQNEIPEAANIAAVEHARASGATTILNLAPYRETPRDLLDAVDYLVVNETEFGQLLGMSSETMTERDVTRLLAGGARLANSVIVTRGPEGVAACLDGSVLSIAGHRVHVTDTTGAGDSFCGAFSTALARRQRPDQALQFANAAAALSVQRLGASAGMPALEDVRAFMDATVN